MKRILSILLAIAMLATMVSLTSCESGKTGGDTTKADETTAAETTGPEKVKQYVADSTIYDQYVDMIKNSDKSKVKLGFIFIGDDEEGYTAAHHAGVKKMCEVLGVDYNTQVVIKWSIPEDEKCLEAAKELVQEGCTVVFGNSFNFEGYMIEAAKLYPEVQFCHATGYQAAEKGLSNLTNYFNNVYESRYVSGVVAGVKLNELVKSGKIVVQDGKALPIGYVGAYPYAEVVSGYTSFFLGIKSVCKYDVEMFVTYTNSWADQALEYDAAKSLIDQYKCVLISQHADTTGAAAACQEKGVYQVGYNVSMIDTAPDYTLTSATLNWGSYYTYAVACAISGEKIATDWSQGYKEGAVLITEINEKAFGSTESYNEAVTASNEAISKIINGSLHVFDTSTWTVDGKKITSTKDVEGYYGKEYINEAGYFMESTLNSAPAFAFRIDGIKELQAK